MLVLHSTNPGLKGASEDVKEWHQDKQWKQEKEWCQEPLNFGLCRSWRRHAEAPNTVHGD